MTKIYEALEQAEKEREIPSAVKTPPIRHVSRRFRALAEKLIALNQRIETQLPDASCRVVVFTGAQPGTESSRLLMAYANLAAQDLAKRTLVITVGPFQKYHGISKRKRGWENVLQGEGTIEDILKQSDDMGPYLSQMAASTSSIPSILASSRLPLVLQDMRQHFELILIDAPAATATWDAVLLSPNANGIVLVVEAGKTRWQVVRHQIEQINAQQGKVLGVLLNNQQYYIPECIYRKML